MSLPTPPEVGEPMEKMDKSLQKENKKLRGDIKQMEMKIKVMQVELTKSYQVKEKLEGLCRELQKQNKYIKAESTAKIQEANSRGKELATEVQNNMGFMKSINDNLAAISAESMMVKTENEELGKKIAILKGHYEEREQILQEALKETHESLQKARVELAETKLQCATEKEKLVREAQKLADALVQSRDQMKHAKEVEISLREMLQSYEDKFKGLQKALKDTNGSYEDFKTEMVRVSTRTKALEQEAGKWQDRWEESNNALQRMKQNYTRVQDDLKKSYENLEKMKGLCRSLHNENRDLQAEVKKIEGGEEPPKAEEKEKVTEPVTVEKEKQIDPSPPEETATAEKEKQIDPNPSPPQETATAEVPSPVLPPTSGSTNKDDGNDAVVNPTSPTAASPAPAEEPKKETESITIPPPIEEEKNRSGPTSPIPTSNQQQQEDSGGSSKGKKNKRKKNKK